MANADELWNCLYGGRCSSADERQLCPTQNTGTTTFTDVTIETSNANGSVIWAVEDALTLNNCTTRNNFSGTMTGILPSVILVSNSATVTINGGSVIAPAGSTLPAIEAASATTFANNGATITNGYVKKLGDLPVSVSCGADKVTLASQTPEAGVTYYYKTTATDDTANKPASYGSAAFASTGWTAFSAATDIPTTGTATVYVQVVKAGDSEQKIYGWRQGSTTPYKISVTIDSTTTSYINHADGWNAAATADSEATVKLLADWTGAADGESTSFGTGTGFGAGAILVPSSKNITLDLNGKTIDRALTQSAENGNVITVRGALTIEDSSSTAVASQGTITGGYNKTGAAASGGVLSDAGSALTLEGGSITGNKSAGWGGGVKNEGGTFTMTGGEISGNSACGSGSVTPPAPVTEIKNGGSTTGANLGSLVSNGKTLTVDGDNGGKLVFGTAALKGIIGQTSGGIRVEMKDVSSAHQENLPGKQVFSLSVSSGSKTISSFSGAVTVTLPYTLKEGETADEVAVWYLASDSTMTEIPCTYNQKTKLATFTVSHFSLYVVGVDTPWVNTFTDVSESDWFYGAVEFANRNGLFTGTRADTFSPERPMTRAMLWTVLGRLDGQSLSGSGVFEAARSWAVGADITDGTNPDGSITREQLVTILWRYAGSPKAVGELSRFSDAGSVADYAAPAMAWAVDNGILEGANGALMPQDSATRAQVAAILQRFKHTVK